MGDPDRSGTLTDDGSPTSDKGADGATTDGTEPTVTAAGEGSIESRYSRGDAPSQTLEFEPHEPTDNLTPDDHEYDEDERIVRIEYRSSTREMSFEAFGRTRSRRAVERHLRSSFERVGIDLPRISLSFGLRKQRVQRSDLAVDFDEYDVLLQVSHLTVFDGDGDVLREPNVDFDRLVEHTPARYDTKTEFASQTYTARVGIVCYRGTRRDIDETDGDDIATSTHRDSGETRR